MQLAHEVILQSGARDLPGIIQILGPMKPTTVLTRNGR